MIVQAVLADPSLPHQIIVNRSGKDGRLVVSCNCLRNRISNFGPIVTGGPGAWDLFRSGRHNEAHAPFDPDNAVTGERVRLRVA